MASIYDLIDERCEPYIREPLITFAEHYRTLMNVESSLNVIDKSEMEAINFRSSARK